MWEMLTELNNYRILHAAAKSLQSCPNLCNPIDGSPPDSSVPGILQAGILEWVIISFSNACMLPHRWQPTRLLHPWVSPGKNTGVGCHFLLQYYIHLAWKAYWWKPHQEGEATQILQLSSSAQKFLSHENT